MGEFTHMKEKMSFFFFFFAQRKHQNFYEKTFSLETLEARGLFFFFIDLRTPVPSFSHSFSQYSTRHY